MATNESALLMKSEEARVMCGIGRNVWLQMIAAKKIPHIRVGRRIMIPRRALLEWIDNQTVKAG